MPVCTSSYFSVVATGVDKLQEQQEAVGAREGLWQALQHDLGKRQGNVDRGMSGARKPSALLVVHSVSRVAVPALHSLFPSLSCCLSLQVSASWGGGLSVLVQIPKTGKGTKGAKPVNKDRFISKMFLRGDSVILVLRNPK
jgi:hypothetical protein